jgi:hypothetical protein
MENKSASGVKNVSIESDINCIGLLKISHELNRSIRPRNIPNPLKKQITGIIRFIIFIEIKFWIIFSNSSIDKSPSINPEIENEEMSIKSNQKNCSLERDKCTKSVMI